MSTDINEYEQSERVKQWLKDNGSGIVIGLVLAIGGVFGFRQWQHYQVERRVEAGQHYSILQDQLGNGEIEAARSALKTLQQDYAGNLFTSLAALTIAGRAQAEDDLDTAAEQYRYVLENGSDESIRAIGGLRLARLQIARGDAEAALQILDQVPHLEAFDGYHQRVRGDAYWALGQHDQALAAYSAARDALGGTPDPLLSLRLDRLEAQAASADSGTPDSEAVPAGDDDPAAQAAPGANDAAGEAT